MADIDFPASLPAARDGELSESALETKVSDPGEVGAPRRRNRFTRMLKRFNFQLLLTSEQKELLLAFYDDDLVRGVLAFNWTHPQTGVEYEASMPARPSAKHMTGQIWVCDVSVEEI